MTGFAAAHARCGSTAETPHSNLQTSPDTHRRARAGNSLHPTQTIPDRHELRPGSAHQPPSHRLRHVCILFIYLFILLSLPPLDIYIFFGAVLVPQSTHPPACTCESSPGPHILDDAAGGRADSGRGEGRRGAGEESPGSRSPS